MFAALSGSHCKVFRSTQTAPRSGETSVRRMGSRFRDAGRKVQHALRPAHPTASGENGEPRGAWERPRKDQIPQAEDRPPRPVDCSYSSHTPGYYDPNQQPPYQAPYQQYQQGQHQPYRPPPAPQYANSNHHQGYGAQQQGNSGGSYNGYDGSATGQTQLNQVQYAPYASYPHQSYPMGQSYGQGASGASSTHSVVPSPTSQTQPNHGQYTPYSSQPNQAHGGGPPNNQGPSSATTQSAPPSGSPFPASGHRSLSRASTIGGYSSTSPPPTGQYCANHRQYTPCGYCQAYS